MPKPPEITDDDIHLLIRKYRDPSRPGLFNYINFDNDIEALRDEIQKKSSVSMPYLPNYATSLPPVVRYLDLHKSVNSPSLFIWSLVVSPM